MTENVTILAIVLVALAQATLVVLTFGRDKELRKLKKRVKDHEKYFARLNLWIQRRSWEQTAMLPAPEVPSPDAAAVTSAMKQQSGPTISLADLKDMPKEVQEWWKANHGVVEP